MWRLYHWRKKLKLKVKKITKKQLIKITLLSIVIIIFISAIYMINQNNQDYQSSSAGKYVKAVVLEVKDDKLEKVLDDLKDKYGKDIIKKANFSSKDNIEFKELK